MNLSFHEGHSSFSNHNLYFMLCDLECKALVVCFLAIFTHKSDAKKKTQKHRTIYEVQKPLLIDTAKSFQRRFIHKLFGYLFSLRRNGTKATTIKKKIISKSRQRLILADAVYAVFCATNFQSFVAHLVKRSFLPSNHRSHHKSHQVLLRQRSLVCHLPNQQ